MVVLDQVVVGWAPRQRYEDLRLLSTDTLVHLCSRHRGSNDPLAARLAGAIELELAARPGAGWPGVDWPL